MLRSGTTPTLDPKEEFLKNWKIKREEIEIQKDSKLGEGGFAQVYKVLLHLCGDPFR
jgi:hypothetical protein